MFAGRGEPFDATLKTGKLKFTLLRNVTILEYCQKITKMRPIFGRAMFCEGA